MTPLTAREIADASGGTLVGGDAAATADAVSTDSRAVPGGCVFVALRGDTFDGHDYLAHAGKSGATVAVVDRDVAVPAGVAVVRVADTRRALGRLAGVVRRRITRPKVIAVAGSNGKTSTKNALHAVLRRTLRGSASPKSSTTTSACRPRSFRSPPTTINVILEIGTNHPGEVEHLSRMSEPDVAVITSIAKSTLSSSARSTRCGARTRRSSRACGRAGCWSSAATNDWPTSSTTTARPSASRPTAATA